MEKRNFKKELKHLYNSSTKKPVFVEVPSMNFLMVDGEGNPNTSKAYKDALEALFSISYTIKFSIKKGAEKIDYGVMPLEGLWFADDMNSFDPADKESWKWTAMIMQPLIVTKEHFERAKIEVHKKKNPTALPLVRMETYEEGKAAQIMHIGPFSEEGPTIQKLHQFIEDKGFQLRGKHHEIYLSDIRRAAPEKWKTIIRQPYK